MLEIAPLNHLVGKLAAPSADPVKVDTAAAAPFAMALEYDDGYRGVLSLQTFDENALPGGKLSPTDMIAGTYSKVSAAALPVRIVLDVN